MVKAKLRLALAVVFVVVGAALFFKYSSSVSDHDQLLID